MPIPRTGGVETPSFTPPVVSTEETSGKKSTTTTTVIITQTTENPTTTNTGNELNPPDTEISEEALQELIKRLKSGGLGGLMMSIAATLIETNQKLRDLTRDIRRSNVKSIKDLYKAKADSIRTEAAFQLASSIISGVGQIAGAAAGAKGKVGKAGAGGAGGGQLLGGILNYFAAEERAKQAEIDGDITGAKDRLDVSKENMDRFKDELKKLFDFIKEAIDIQNQTNMASARV